MSAPRMGNLAFENLRSFMGDQTLLARSVYTEAERARGVEDTQRQHIIDLREVLAGLMPGGHLSTCPSRRGVKCSERCTRARAVLEKTEPTR